MPATVEKSSDLSETEVPIVEFLGGEDAIEIENIRELGMGWAWLSMTYVIQYITAAIIRSHPSCELLGGLGAWLVGDSMLLHLSQ